MKHTFTGMMIALMLVLALVIGAVALAENAEPEIPETPAVEQTQPEAPSTDTAADSTALQDAFKAYNEARSSSHQEELEAELKGYVESGKLTQEQADLILASGTAGHQDGDEHRLTGLGLTRNHSQVFAWHTGLALDAKQELLFLDVAGGDDTKLVELHEQGCNH